MLNDIPDGGGKGDIENNPEVTGKADAQIGIVDEGEAKRADAVVMISIDNQENAEDKQAGGNEGAQKGEVNGDAGGGNEQSDDGEGAGCLEIRVGDTHSIAFHDKPMPGEWEVRVCALADRVSIL